MAPLSVAATNELQTHSFPILTAAQVDRVLAWGKQREVKSGEVLIEPNEINPPFFVVLSGSVEIVQPGLNGEQVIATHGPNQFTGELTTISGQRSLVRARVLQGGKVIEVTAEGLRSFVDRNSDLSEILMRAFIMRRLGMVSAGQGNVFCLGRDTLHGPWSSGNSLAGIGILTNTSTLMQTMLRKKCSSVSM